MVSENKIGVTLLHGQPKECLYIEWIPYDDTYIHESPISKLNEFYKGCSAPEIVSSNIPVCKPADLR